MNQALIDAFSEDLQNFLEVILTSIKSKENESPQIIVDSWHTYEQSIRAKVYELTFKTIEKHDIDLNNIKSNEKGLLTEVLFSCTNIAKNKVDKLFYEDVKRIIYNAF
jgi:hypothetical protein